LGDLNLSKGGSADLQYALRLGAGFGSQIAMLLLRAIPGHPQRVLPEVYQRWLADVSGYEQADLEVVQHTLRIRHDGPPVRTPARSTWKFGQGPSLFAPVPKDEPEQTAPTPVAEQAQTGATFEQIRDFVLAQVSEKTGYAADMLDPDLDLEADLGIDTVKQAELFATIRQHYNIPRREDLRLADYNTLRKVMAFVQEGLGSVGFAEANVQQPAEPVETVLPEPAPSAEPVEVEPAKVEVEAAQPVKIGAAFDRQAICQKVLDVVSQKTGYPPEMLDMELDLEADLGIDTVKQAEMFAEVRSHYGIARREDLRLADYNTLARVVDFVEEALTAQATVQGEQAPEQQQMPLNVPALSPERKPVRRRVPVPVLRGRLDLYLPTGVTLETGTAVWIIDGGKVAEALARRLRARSVRVMLLSAEQVLHEFDRLSSEPPQGVYDLTALTAEPNWTEMDKTAWQEALNQRTLPLYQLLHAFSQLSFVIAATRMGGLHGYGLEGATDALGGAVSGLVKALGRERPACFVKVVDFGDDLTDAKIATRLLEETLKDADAVEVGWRGQQRFGVATLDQPLPEDVFDLPEKPVFLVSGGSGGITVPILRDLAQRTQGCFYLLGRTPLPENRQDVDWLRRDREGLRAALIERMGKPTPVQVEQVLSGLERAAAVFDLLSEIEQLGGRAIYRVCDVQQAEAVRRVVTEIVAAEGRVDVLIHAAGVERSRKIESKPLDEFQATLAIKATGLFNLYQAIADTTCKAMILFGSVAGRFGNAGQTDYSAANDLLARMALYFRRVAPQMKVLTLDWGAWGEVGMASRGSLPKLMQRAGVELLSPQDAAPLVYQELMHGHQSTEVVLAGKLGLLEEAGRKPEGGLDLEQANRALTEGNPRHVMLSRLTHYDADQWIWLEAELDPNQQPFLKDHAMNGTPLLPGVMGIEGFSVAAQHITSVLGSSEQELQVIGLEDVQFLTPLKFYRNEARRICWKAQIRPEGQALTAYVSLESEQVRWQGEAEVQIHFRAKVHLSVVAPQPLQLEQVPHWNGQYTLSAEDVYRLYFHGPAFRVLQAVQRSGEGLLARMNPTLPPLTETVNLLTNPLLLELCLQTAGLWQAGATGALALPSAIGRLLFYASPKNDVPVYAEVYPRYNVQGQLSFDARVLDESGQVYLEVRDYRTAELPDAIDSGLRSLLQPLVSAN
jgi:NAD(P)-dependent dehydrogenase (short-subunit alcohol dehydrogenase family)/acyl carrier protein/3-hydroxymyristoyl/3-hydroxydecanoyl-(acyl carrier protein) dehydratase